ncbi:MAG TPA: nuclear transport factor 2 family protein [Xanthomonadales bacterium]|nr:nuclear transport factor 2 family protein [Xanthomonadales bacterium]
MRIAFPAFLCIALAACAASPTAVPAADDATLKREVAAAETAFAQTMADRDFAAFGSFIADDAVFLNGGKPLRGKAAILAFWQKFYADAEAPFAWKPDLVQVLPTGALAQTVGPVTGPDGKVFARFYSTWRRAPDGRWQIVLDNGYTVCGPE